MSRQSSSEIILDSSLAIRFISRMGRCRPHRAQLLWNTHSFSMGRSSSERTMVKIEIESVGEVTEGQCGGDRKRPTGRWKAY